MLNVDANPVSVFDVYVSGTGSDESGDGSLANPFATILSVLWKVKVMLILI